MANTRGIFSLIDIQERVFFNNWIPLSDVWIAPSSYYTTAPNTGYFGGGTTPGGDLATMDKVTYPTNTTSAVPTANLTVTRKYLGATGNAINGYFGSSRPADTTATMDKVTYSTDTIAYIPTANLTTTIYGRYALAATGNSTDGYFAGGYTPSSLSWIDKVTYSTDTKTLLSNYLSAAKAYIAATGSSTAGYFGGGYFPPTTGRLTNMDKITYSTDTTAYTPTANLSVGRNTLSATGNSTAGYFGGGYDGSNPVATVDKVTYSTDTTVQVPGASFSTPRYGNGSTGNSTTGYFGGGYNISQSNVLTTMDKVTYSTDTTAAVPGANLSVARMGLAGASPKANAVPDSAYIVPAPSGLPKRYSDGVESISNTGYFGGGSFTTSNHSRTIDKVNYYTDTTTLGGSLISARYSHGATGNTTNGYFGGGNPGTMTSIDKVTYSTDSAVQVPAASLSAGRYYISATGNSIAGYFAGGNPGPTALVDKITYSTDTRSTIPATFLSAGRRSIAATGNQTAGYFGGGYVPGTEASRMDKLTYSTDTTVYTPTANLSIARGQHAATGNSTHGYFGGGYPGFSRIDKLTYASDTTAFTPTANLTSARYNIAATGNSTNGYFGGGGASGGTTNGFSTMDKVTYSTDTTASSPTSRLTSGKGQPAATGARANGMSSIDPPASTPTSTTYPYEVTSPNTGYFSGGEPGTYSSMDKLNYSTDSTAAAPATSFSIPRRAHGATGNSVAGYLGGGGPGAYLTTTLMDKVTYSTDTTFQIPTTTLSSIRNWPGAAGNSTNGYFVCGSNENGSQIASMDKLTYSTDTREGGIGLAFAFYGLTGTGNQTAGYFGGGYPGSASMVKIVYSTDIGVSIPGLSVGRDQLAATGNSTNGYFGGGNYGQTKVDKVTYSTDTTVATPTANLVSPRVYLAATGNSTAGYFGGGSGGGATIDKVTYSTDTTVQVPTAALSIPRLSFAASSARANGLPQPTYTAPSPNLV